MRAETATTVFAAASVSEALNAALQDYEGPTRMSLGGSGAIARQVVQGAPADVVMLANPSWMDWLETQGVLLPNTRTDPIGNQLVVVGPPGALVLSDFTEQTIFARLGNDGRIATGEHRSVPIGQYAKTWLDSLGLWDTLRPRLAEVENVRAALALVARGDVPLAILYQSDLTAAPDAAQIVWTLPDDQQPDIQYSIAAMTEAGIPLARYLSGPEARAHFLAFGFSQVQP